MLYIGMELRAIKNLALQHATIFWGFSLERNEPYCTEVTLLAPPTWQPINDVVPFAGTRLAAVPRLRVAVQEVGCILILVPCVVVEQGLVAFDQVVRPRRPIILIGKQDGNLHPLYWPSECDDVIRRGARQQKAEGYRIERSLMDCVAPPSKGGNAIHQCPRADSWLLRGDFDRPGGELEHV